MPSVENLLVSLRLKKHPLEETSVPQETYFQIASEIIEKSQGDLYIVGIDKAFWQYGPVQEAILKVLNHGGRNLHAVISSERDFYRPEWFTAHPQVDITWALGEFTSGFLIAGKNGVMIWDSRYTTYHPIEKQEGVIYRSVVVEKKSPSYLEHFYKMQEKAKLWNFPPPSGDLEALRKIFAHINKTED